MQITLTFDNGPTPGVTEPVLEILARHGAQATFFIIGQKLLDKSSAGLLAEIKSAGHWVGNHTMSHSVAFGERLGATEACREID
jgi:peptidoglycan-N-acetylglucosamine deacetylase